MGENVLVAQALLSIDAARAAVLAEVAPLSAETVPVTAALRRVLRETVRAAGPTPPFDCSAMDGYAIEPGAAGRELVVCGESRAGAPASSALGPGEAHRISTGAAIPAGAEAVIRQEDVERHDGHIRTLTDTAPGENIRSAGEDMEAGHVVLGPGARLGAAELGAAVAAGAGALVVSRRPRVHVLSTGDELREPGAPLAPGQIHNSNGTMLRALAELAGAEVTTPPPLADDRAATVIALAEALEDADLVLVAGGVSVGPHDHVKPALAELGVQERFWGISLQPGKPTWFGVRAGALVFGLPGNPVSAYVTFVLFAAPALAALQGAGTAPVALRAALASAVARNPQREMAVRVRLEHRDGELVAVPNGAQGSHIVTSLVGADGLARIPAGEGTAAAGTPVAVIPV